MRTPSLRLRDVQVDPYFQRYFDTRPMAPVRGELFSRPDTEQPTEQFFAALESHEHLQVLAWLLEVAAHVFTSTGMRSSINVDAAIVSTPRTRNEFLRTAGLAACPVTFEFGEVPDGWTSEEMNRLLVQIREREHECALDGFGRGGIDLADLRNFRFDTVKIAGSVTVSLDRGLEFQEHMERIHETIVDAGMQPVVQGVESQANFQWLQEVGFTTFQGYWFSIPAPADGVSAHA